MGPPCAISAAAATRSAAWPLLVVASAWKPNDASSFAEPWSQGLGRSRGRSPRCRARNRLAFSACSVMRALLTAEGSVSLPLLHPMALEETLAKERVVGHEPLGLCAGVALEGDRPPRPVPEGSPQEITQPQLPPVRSMLWRGRLCAVGRILNEVEVQKAHFILLRDLWWSTGFGHDAGRNVVRIAPRRGPRPGSGLPRALQSSPRSRWPAGCRAGSARCAPARGFARSSRRALAWTRAIARR